MSEQRQSIPSQKRIQRIQLEPYDDAVSIKDRLQFVNAGRVLLVFPKKGKILQRKLDLVLVQREATRLGLRLALVTEDATIAENAESLNISAFYTIEQARTQRWKRPQNKVFISRNDRPNAEPSPYLELQRKASRLRPARSKRAQARLQLVRGLIFGVAILAVLFGLYAAVPSATVRITPASDQLTATIPIMADPNLDRAYPERLSIPADVRRFIQDATVTIETTGERNAENSLAEGVVTLTNDTGIETFVPVGTVVQSQSAPPVQFTTLEEVALPARQGATVDVRIRALESSSGVKGNLPANTITLMQGPLSQSVSVINYNPTYGGGIRSTSYPTDADYTRLQTLARQQLKQNARDFLLLSLDEGSSFLVTETIVIVEERTFFYSAEINEPAESVSLTMQAVVEATVIDLNAARLVAFANLGNYIAEGRLLDERSLTFRQGEILQVMDDGRVAFQMRVEGSSLVDVNPSQVADMVAGKSAGEARELLETAFLLDPRHPPEISTFPAIFNRLPIVSSRITVEIVE